MKVCILGDTHFGARNDNPTFHRFFERFYSEVFFPTLRERGIRNIVQVGDLFDRRKYINYVTLKECKRYFFDPLHYGGYQLDAVIGNHDTYYKNTNRVNSPHLLLGEYAQSMRFYERSTEILMTDEFQQGVFVLLVPWICDDNRQQTMELIDKTQAQVCIGHLELQDFEMYRGQRIFHLEKAFDHKLFQKFDVVLSGHFHHRQQRDNITYVGTPYEITWSDFDDLKGFHIFDTATRELEFIPNPNTLFRKIWYNDEGKQISEVNAEVDFDTYRETYVKVIVSAKTNPYGFDMFIDKLEKAGAYDVQTVDDHLNKDKTTDDEISSDAEDTLTIISKSIEQLGDGIDQEKLGQLLNSLYTEALKVE